MAAEPPAPTNTTDRRWTAVAGAGAVVLLSLAAVRSLFGGDLLFTGDTLHPWRLFEMDRCLGDGQLPCRWTPDLAHGYGVPLFNYYPPLPYYAGAVLHRLGFSIIQTVNLLYLLGLLGAGLSMYALARRLWGGLGGVVSAVAYVYAPYLALDAYLRGALDELWALAVAPALFWAVYELVTAARPRFVPLVAALVAALFLSHHLVAVVIAPGLALWSGALLLGQGRAAVRPALLGAAGAVWGLALATFFVLPVLMEGDLVQLDSIALDLEGEEALYETNFASPGELFGRRSADYGLLLRAGDETPVQIGWFHWGLAGLSLPAAAVLVRRGRRREALPAALLAVMFGIGVFMALSRSRFVWDAFDALRFLQFPWRYLGLVSLAASGLAGVWFAAMPERPPGLRLAAATALVGVLIGTGWAFFRPLHACDASDERYLFGTRAEGARADEVCDTLLSGTPKASTSDYWPKGVDDLPEPEVSPARAVAGIAEIVDSRATSDALHLEVDAATDARVVASVLDFPNWRVRIDGVETPHTAETGTGRIEFAVPAGRHRIDIDLEDTGVRRLADRISLAGWALFGLVAAGWALPRRLRSGRSQAAGTSLVGETF